MSKVVAVLGASGYVGTGFIKACLESSHALKIVGVFRTNESAEKTKALLGNPPEEKFVTIVGNLATEENGAELLKAILDRVGDISDVIASMGERKEIGPILNQSLQEFKDNISTNKLEPYFCAAKTFIPYLCDKPNTSYTVVNGATAIRPYPGGTNMTVANAALAKLTKALMSDYKDRSVRINEIMIACPARQWNNLPPGAVSNIEMGKCLLGIIVHPTARSLSMVIYRGNMEQIAETGVTDNVCNVLLYF